VSEELTTPSDEGMRGNRMEGRDGEKDARRELGETHAVAMRTHNAVATLAQSVKEVVIRQGRYERGLNLNSFVAYVLYTVLLGGGFYLLYRARAEVLVGERTTAIVRRDEAVAEATAARHEVELREEATRKALEFWQLLDQGRRADAIARYPEVAALKLTPTEREVFRVGVARARAELVETGYAAGVEAFRAGQWKKAATELERMLVYEAEGPRAAQARYYRAVSLHKLGDFQDAVRILEQAIADGVERTVTGADARYFLGAAYEMLRQPEKARAEYTKFSDAQPNHPMYWPARRRIVELNQRLAPKPGAAPAAPAAPAASPKP
jgi:tetratricopeptide (TPR) repeat protein